MRYVEYPHGIGRCILGKAALEQHQVWIYLGAVCIGLLFGTFFANQAAALEWLLWPTLGLLLFATFTQVPLIHLAAAFRDRQFISAVLAGNFIAIPLVVWGLLAFVPVDPAIKLGVLLVLLVPCTDWYITFTHLSGGDTGRAIAITPINLLVQIALLPVYLWLFIGRSFTEIFVAGTILTVFVTLILFPLLAAALLERWVAKQSDRSVVLDRIGWCPVPLLGLVVFLIAASQVQSVFNALPVFGQVSGVFIAFLVAAVIIGIILTKIFRLQPRAGRALVFSLGTRNSFVVLPLALALSAEWQMATVVIVLQSLIELFGMLIYLQIMPWIIPNTQEEQVPPA